MSASTHVPADLFYFGPAQRQLFGALDEAQTFDQREHGIVLCNPFGHEYVRAHRAMRHLALRLAQAGFPVLRFDYGGAGDSAGNAEDASLADWSSDIGLALDTLRDRTGIESVCLAGLRLGASLALEVSARRRDVSALVLWEPIVLGLNYLDELTEQHQELVWRFFDNTNRLSAGDADELLGFPVSAGLRADLEHLNVLTCTLPRVTSTLMVEREASKDSALLLQQLRAANAGLTYELIPSFPAWREDVDKGLVPDPTLRGIVAWAVETLP
jgi:pimeloyl-ACP methyl ester carboxylesterase